MSKLSLVTLATLLTLPSLAFANMKDVSCDDSARLRSMLSETIGAERQGVGLRDPETILEIWVTERNGEWLIVQNYANGTSCIVAMGGYWENTQAGPV
ncbi:hypothetical protein BVC71_13425 [Marivivens niveibacter]|uniref:Uncharacterized protein n=1 Tax=Marivivens niveibacter TaxID=1930667 RepID=A0A251WWG8_9RHOB|nr:hypothetical protein [Marivivens niveibacter]OUD08495.1 hypothetical protein BVC71_13425 [Marivivens niveibacter]